MSSLETFITERLHNQTTQIATVTFRLPEADLVNVDEVASELNLTRQDLLVEFVNYGLKKAQELIQQHDDVPVGFDKENHQKECYYLVNTNSRNNHSDHNDMLHNGEVAAFFGKWKYLIDQLKKGDRIFLYQSGVGIVATGLASGKINISDHPDHTGKICAGEKHAQKLDEFVKDFTISLKVCKEITKSNLPVLRTMSRLREAQGKALWQAIQKL